jgi:hypothetical protein
MGKEIEARPDDREVIQHNDQLHGIVNSEETDGSNEAMLGLVFQTPKGDSYD